MAYHTFFLATEQLSATEINEMLERAERAGWWAHWFGNKHDDNGLAIPGIYFRKHWEVEKRRKDRKKSRDYAINQAEFDFYT